MESHPKFGGYYGKQIVIDDVPVKLDSKYFTISNVSLV